MKIYKKLERLKDIPIALAIGFFDGVHLAHAKILNTLNKEAQRIGGKSLVTSFQPHPRQVLQPDVTLSLLNTQTEKENLISEHGIDFLFYIEFTNDFAQLSYEQFITWIQSKINLSSLVLGYNHNFGNKREGNWQTLQQLKSLSNVNIIQVEELTFNNEAISSSRIRNAFEIGDFNTINGMLGYCYNINVLPIEKKENLTICKIIDEEKILPLSGFYHTKIENKECLIEILPSGLKVYKAIDSTEPFNICFI